MVVAHVVLSARTATSQKILRIPDEKIRELVKVIPKILKEATDKIDKAYPGKVNDEVKEFLKIHRRTDKSPTGYPIHIDTKGSRKTYYTDEQVLYMPKA